MKSCSRLFLLSLITALSFLTSCVQSPKKLSEGQSLKLHYDTSVIAIIPLDSVFFRPFDIKYKAATLTQDDIVQIQKLFKTSIDRYNASIKSTSRQYYGVNLRKYNYRRQYVCVTNSKGEKEVFINCFCEIDNDNWKKQLVVVYDGGNCFFSFKINLSTEDFYEFSVNGYA